MKGSYFYNLLLHSVAVFTVISFSLTLLPSSTAEAKRVKACADDEIPIADERGQGYVLCLTPEEWEKAIKICAKISEETNPLECVCQDGDTIGACGD